MFTVINLTKRQYSVNSQFIKFFANNMPINFEKIKQGIAETMPCFKWEPLKIRF
jgi:hypothetical protein